MGDALLQPSPEFTSTLGQGSESITFTWDFGDGSAIFTGPMAAHTFAPGVYTATLTAISSLGRLTTTVRIVVPYRQFLIIVMHESTLPMEQKRRQ